MAKNNLKTYKTLIKFNIKLNQLTKQIYCLLAKLFLYFIIYCRLGNLLGFLVFPKWLLLIANLDFHQFFITSYF